MNRTRQLLRTAISSISVLTALIPSLARTEDATFTGTCTNGAQAAEEKYCRFFEHYEKGSRKLDPRIADALSITKPSETRAIGFVIAISEYPHIEGANVPAAKVDGDRLVDFLKKQKFDEIIVLRNADATQSNIDYFLKNYLLKRASEFNGKARLLIAYSGHGRNGDSDGVANNASSFVLGEATSVEGDRGMYDMQDFANHIVPLAGRYFHIITLINACYGAGFFTAGSPGGNPDSFTLPGSIAITAGNKNDIVSSLDPSKGSLFFDLLIAGITDGTADTRYRDALGAVSQDGKKILLEGGGLTRSLELVGYLTSSYLNIKHRVKQKSALSLNDPWYGAAQKGVAQGGFFFLSDYTVKSPMTAALSYTSQQLAEAQVESNRSFSVSVPAPKNPSKLSELDRDSSRSSSFPVYPAKTENSTSASAANISPVSLPTGPVSSIPGRPDIKIFKAPEIYPIQGYDFSSAEGNIDWATFSKTPRPKFIYSRAIGWNAVDRTFLERWDHAKTLGVDRGAYIKFNFCKSVKEQIIEVTSVVPQDEDALPIAIELVNPKGENTRQLECFKKKGLRAAQNAILELAHSLEKIYAKTPLLYGNRNNLSTFLDQRSDEFMIWLGSYGTSGITLRGRNPWTLWQFSGTLNVAGVGSNVTGEVFFGNEEQYEEFKSGKTNVALKAVTQ